MAKSTEGMQSEKEFRLVIYVAGETPKMKESIANLEKICEEELHGRYHIEVIDLRKHPERASTDQILAIPTVVLNLPLPIKRLIGDLSQKEKVIVGLNIREIK